MSPLAFLILFVILVVLVLLLACSKCKSIQESYTPAYDPDLVKITCTSTFPGNRETTNTLAYDYITKLGQGDIMLLSGVYVDFDPAGAASFLTAIGDAIQRGAAVFIFTDPALDVKKKSYDNRENLAPALELGVYWYPMGSGGGLNSHIKLLDFIYVSDKRAISYYGSFNPFSPVTAEAGVFIEGPLSAPIIKQSIFRDRAFLNTYVEYAKRRQHDHHHSSPEPLIDLIKTLEPLGQALDAAQYTLPEAMIVYPKGSFSQCVSDETTALVPSTAWQSADDSFFFVNSVAYGIGLMPESRLKDFGVGPEASARTMILGFLKRAQKYIKMGLLFNYFSDEQFIPEKDEFQAAFAEEIAAALERGVFVSIYTGTYNDKVNFLDKPHYSKFIAYVTRSNRIRHTGLQFLVFPAISLHFKFYISERDTLISNNMPTGGMYDSIIQGVDICFYDCPEINAFFDNLYNGFVSTFTDNTNELYDSPDAVYSLPVGSIPTSLNFALCGEGQFAGVQGCCLPKSLYPIGNEPAFVCLMRFVPSYVNDPYNPAGFFMQMLEVIDASSEFIYIINEFTHLGCSDAEFAKLSPWNAAPIYSADGKTTYSRRDINKLFYNALTAALSRGVDIYIVSSSETETMSDGSISANDTLTPSLADFVSQHSTPGRVFRVPFEAYMYTYRNAEGQVTTYHDQKVFVHDKLYVTDTAAYVGGQNWYAPLEFDAGFLFMRGPIYMDLLARAQNFARGSHLPIEYTALKPFKGPVFDLSTGVQIPNAEIYPFFSPQEGGESTPFSTLSARLLEPATGILDVYLDQIANAEGQLDIICWTLSPTEFFATDPNKAPYFINPRMIEAILKAAANPKVTQVTVILCIYSFQYEMAEYKDPSGDTYCTGKRKGDNLNPDVLRAYRAAYQTLYDMLSANNVTLYLQGSIGDNVVGQISSCNLLHAKIIASATSISASSANYTPGYFFQASNTGVVLKYQGANQLPLYQDFRARVLAQQAEECRANCGVAGKGHKCLERVSVNSRAWEKHCSTK